MATVNPNSFATEYAISVLAVMGMLAIGTGVVKPPVVSVSQSLFPEKYLPAASAVAEKEEAE